MTWQRMRGWLFPLAVGFGLAALAVGLLALLALEVRF